MAHVIGPHAQIDTRIPTGIDGAEIVRRSLEQGMTEEQAIALAGVGIGEANERIVSTYNGLIYTTTEFWKRYRTGQGARRMTPRAAEFSRNDAVRGAQVGHMFPRHDYEDAIEWTKQFRERADVELVRASVMEVADSWIDRFDYDFWTRALTTTEEPVGAGYSVPWAIGTGTNVNYIPPNWMSNSFDANHTHFLFYDSASIGWNTAFEGAMQELRHHGNLGPGIVIYVAQADIAAISAVAGYSALEQPNVILVGGNASSPVRYSRGSIEGAPGELIGFYNSAEGWGQAEVRWHPRVPQNYAFAAYSRGGNHPQNPFAVHVGPEGFGLRVDARMTPTRTPKVEAITFEGTFGIGTNERTSGVAIYRANSAVAYVNPSIS